MSKGGRIGLIIGVVILLFVMIFVFQGIKIYNQMVSLDQATKNAWADIETQLQRRYDLIPNLVETVKGYASHEREVLIQVTEARAKVGGAQTIPEKIQANNELSSALSRLLVVIERYPDLKANENFIRLQDELAGTENRIAVSRRRYNESVQVFNQKILSFPTVVIARLFNFLEKPYFEAPKEAKQAPKVDFSS